MGGGPSILKLDGNKNVLAFIKNNDTQISRLRDRLNGHAIVNQISEDGNICLHLKNQADAEKKCKEIFSEFLVEFMSFEEKISQGNLYLAKPKLRQISSINVSFTNQTVTVTGLKDEVIKAISLIRNLNQPLTNRPPPVRQTPSPPTIHPVPLQNTFVTQRPNTPPTSSGENLAEATTPNRQNSLDSETPNIPSGVADCPNVEANERAPSASRDRFVVTDDHCVTSSYHEYVVIAPEQTVARFIRFSNDQYEALKANVIEYATIVIRKDRKIEKWVYSFRKKRYAFVPGDFSSYCQMTLNNFLTKFASQSKRFNANCLVEARQLDPAFFEDRSRDQNNQLFVQWYLQRNNVFVCGLTEDVEAKIKEIVDHLDQLVPKTFSHHFAIEIPDQQVASFLFHSVEHNRVVKQPRQNCRMSVRKSTETETFCMHFNTEKQITEAEKALFENDCKILMENFLHQYISCQVECTPELRDFAQTVDISFFEGNADLKVEAQENILLTGKESAVKQKQLEIKKKEDELRRRKSGIPDEPTLVDLVEIRESRMNFVYICNRKEKQILKFILDTNWERLYWACLHFGKILIDPIRGIILICLYKWYKGVKKQCSKKLNDLFNEYQIWQMRERPSLLEAVMRHDPSCFTNQVTTGCKVYAGLHKHLHNEVLVIGEIEECENRVKQITDNISIIKGLSPSAAKITTVMRETCPANTAKVVIHCGIVNSIKKQFGEESISCSIENEKLEIKGTEKTVKEIQTKIQAMKEKLSRGIPNIDSTKIDYLKNMLCSNNSNAVDILMEINRHLLEKGIKGVLIWDNDLILVTNGVFSDASHLLDLFVKLEAVEVPDMLADVTSVPDWKKLAEENPDTHIVFQDQKVFVVGIHNDSIQTAVHQVEKFYCDNKQNKRKILCQSKIAEFCIKRCAVSWPILVKTQITPSCCELSGPSKNVLEAEKMFLAVAAEYHMYMLQVKQPGFLKYAKSKEWSEFVESVEEKKCCKVLVPELTLIEPQFDKSLAVISNNPRNECFYGKVKVKVCTGDITKDDSDVIINGCRNDFNLNWGTASKAIYQRAGPQIQKQCSESPVQQSANIRVTNGWNLLCKFVVHVVTPHSLDQLAGRLKEALDFAELMSASSVAVATLGAGGIGFDIDEVANAFSKAIEAFVDANPVMVKTIKIVVYETSIVSRFSRNVIQAKLLSDSGDIAFKAASQDLQTILEPVILSVCCGSEVEYNNIRAMVEEHVNSKSSKETLKNEEFQQFTNHEWVAIFQHALHYYVMIDLKRSHKLTIHGLTENVDKVKAFINIITLDFQQSMLLYGKSCSWKWSLTNGVFKKLPLRVGKSIEIAYRKRETNFSTKLFGFDMMVDTVQKSFTFQGFRGNLLRCDNDAQEIPPNWDDMNGMTLRRVEIASSSLEYQRVLSHFKASKPRFLDIVKIERIQNPTLYQQYNIKKKDVESHLTSINPVERELFHGTTDLVADKICAKGFNRSFCGKNATKYGKGVYFALNSKYSTDYTAQIGIKCMFLVKVLTGDFCLGDESLLEPPAKPGAIVSSRSYDSASDDMTNPYIFVVFNDTSAYPLYLITFL